MTTGLAAFLAVAVVIIVTPGPDTALTIRNTLLGGQRGGIFTALGVAAGQTAWTVATSAGVSALLVASETAFTVVKLVGAAYLVVLGLQALRSAVVGSIVRAQTSAPRHSSTLRRLEPRSAFAQGLISNLANPKMAVFFPALLPQFAAAGDGAFLVLLLLGLTFALMTLAWLTCYALAVARLGALLVRPLVRRTLEAITGTTLIGLGLRLAMHSHEPI